MIFCYLQENDKKSKLYAVDKESKKLDNKIYLDDLKNEGERLDAECSVTEQRIRNAKNTAKLGKLDRAIEFNETITSNQKRDISDIQDRAVKFSKSSSSLGIISGLTTCVSLGLWLWSKKLVMAIFVIETIFITIAVLFAAKKVNDQVKTLSSFCSKFNQKKDKRKNIILIGKIISILCYTSFSIWTNVTFWNQFFDPFGTYLFSFIFDFLSILLAVEADVYSDLEFNDKYVNEINLVFDSGENNFESYETEKEFDSQDVRTDDNDMKKSETKNEDRPFGQNEKKTLQK